MTIACSRRRGCCGVAVLLSLVCTCGVRASASGGVSGAAHLRGAGRSSDASQFERLQFIHITKTGSVPEQRIPLRIHT
jgi:hypothetical protein